MVRVVLDSENCNRYTYSGVETILTVFLQSLYFVLPAIDKTNLSRLRVKSKKTSLLFGELVAEDTPAIAESLVAIHGRCRLGDCIPPFVQDTREGFGGDNMELKADQIYA
jgi:hypothetical protein